ncbi:MAG: hypothetical protein LUE98_09415 [Tannerellaceae bacterium]|nr:hypothetical protein [Tannerellaceae bacterium]
MRQEDREKEFKQQMIQNDTNVLDKFNTDPEFEYIRKLYKANFNQIVNIVKDRRNTPRTVCEPIGQLDNGVLFNDVINKMDWLIDINRMIRDGQITANDIND